MNACKKSNITIDRKIMAYLIVNKPEEFNAIFSTAIGA
ncbi:MAG: hypothetical protein ACD_48C00153G0002 [uncultured bacterium]|nr:MAG: hypothetical protein ACD_48C00153G0002 [uncultured bacterium]